MTENPNRTADVLATVRQERLENAVEELMTAKEAGTLGKPRELASRTEAHEDNEDTLRSEFEDATAPVRHEDGQPPLITNGPGEQPLIKTDPALPPGTAHVALKVGDAALSATGDNTHHAVTLGVKAVQNAVEASKVEGNLRAKGVAFMGMMGVDAAQVAAGGEDPGPAGQAATDDAKSYVKTVAEAKYGSPSPSPDEQGPLIQ